LTLPKRNRIVGATMAGRLTVRPRVIGVVAFLLCLGSATVSAQAQTNEFRGLWVDAWGGGFFNYFLSQGLCRARHFFPQLFFVVAQAPLFGHG
jgi:hypothetical protein